MGFFVIMLGRCTVLLTHDLRVVVRPPVLRASRLVIPITVIQAPYAGAFDIEPPPSGCVTVPFDVYGGCEGTSSSSGHVGCRIESTPTPTYVFHGQPERQAYDEFSFSFEEMTCELGDETHCGEYNLILDECDPPIEQPLTVAVECP